MYKRVLILSLTILLLSGCSLFLPKNSAVEQNQPKISDEKTEIQKNESLNEEVTSPKTPIDPLAYRDYTDTAIQEAFDAEKIPVLFFYATWCPTCNEADRDIRENIGDVDQNISIIKVNYDTATLLKKKYNITYQHTFVLVSSDKSMGLKWQGGGLESINSHVN